MRWDKLRDALRNYSSQDKHKIILNWCREPLQDVAKPLSWRDRALNCLRPKLRMAPDIWATDPCFPAFASLRCCNAVLNGRIVQKHCRIAKLRSGFSFVCLVACFLLIFVLLIWDCCYHCYFHCYCSHYYHDQYYYHHYHYYNCYSPSLALLLYRHHRHHYHYQLKIYIITIKNILIIIIINDQSSSLSPA